MDVVEETDSAEENESEIGASEIDVAVKNPKAPNYFWGNLFVIALMLCSCFIIEDRMSRWYLLIAIGVFAVLLFSRRKSTTLPGRFSFSLRLLVFFLAILQVIISWFVMLGERSKRELEISERLKFTRNAVTFYGYQIDEKGVVVSNPMPPGPEFIRRRSHDQLFAQIASVKLNDCGEVKRMNDLSGLTELLGLKHLAIQNLNRLETFEGVEQFSLLESLKLEDTSQLKDISALRGLRNLKHLTLVNFDLPTHVEDIALLPKLETLDLTGCADLPDWDSMRLKSINLLDIEAFKGNPTLKHMTQLRVVYFRSSSFEAFIEEGAMTSVLER